MYNDDGIVMLSRVYYIHKEMSNENKTIHEFDFNLICEYFLNTERQGPGFIDRFNSNARGLNLQDRVKGIVGSMDNLPFGEGELDLIWSEGAIYNIGFERGLNEWRKYLKTGGYIAVSESAWFTEERPAEIHDFWMEAYPQIDTIPNQVALIQKAGYLPVASFILPETCWTEHYFAPLVKAREKFLAKYPGNKTAEELVAMSHHEEELYRKYKGFYGYVFYIAKKITL